MRLSKKETSILIEILFSLIFALVFMPFFYKNQETSFDINDLMQKVIEIVIFAVVYFSISYTLIEIFYKNKISEDERWDLINSQSYKLGYWLYEFSLLIFIGTLITSETYQNGEIIFILLTLLIMVSIIKSSYQFYLHRAF